MKQSARPKADALAIGQGLFYAATGVWPLVDMETFLAATGPKTDRWLVKTVGVTVTAIGGVLLLAGWRGALTPELKLLGAASALGLAAIDLVYSMKGRISPVYALDAIAEGALAAGWSALAAPR